LRAQKHSSPAFRTPVPFLVLPLAFAGCVLLLVASGWIGMSFGLAWLAAGLCAYLTARFFHRRRTVQVKSQQNPGGNAPSDPLSLVSFPRKWTSIIEEENSSMADD